MAVARRHFDIRLPRTDLINGCGFLDGNVCSALQESLPFQGDGGRIWQKDAPSLARSRLPLLHLETSSAAMPRASSRKSSATDPNVPVISLKSHGEMAHLLDLAGFLISR